MGEEKDLMHNLISELRRGTLILSVLSQLSEAKYGYALVQSLEEKGSEDRYGKAEQGGKDPALGK